MEFKEMADGSFLAANGTRYVQTPHGVVKINEAKKD